MEEPEIMSLYEELSELNRIRYREKLYGISDFDFSYTLKMIDHFLEYVELHNSLSKNQFNEQIDSYTLESIQIMRNLNLIPPLKINPILEELLQSEDQSSSDSEQDVVIYDIKELPDTPEFRELIREKALQINIYCREDMLKPPLMIHSQVLSFMIKTFGRERTIQQIEDQIRRNQQFPKQIIIKPNRIKISQYMTVIL
jgi:hypothetical protein